MLRFYFSVTYNILLELLLLQEAKQILNVKDLTSESVEQVTSCGF